MLCITGYGELNLIHHKILSYVYEKNGVHKNFRLPSSSLKWLI